MKRLMRGQVAVAFVFACLFVQVCLADSKFSGRVVKVVDGDTIDVLIVEKTVVRVRLAGIDAPERKQPYSKRSRQHLAQLVAGKEVVVRWTKKDRYDRVIGKVLIGNIDISLTQLENGLGWHFKRFQHEQTEADRVAYERAEARARKRAVGLWSQRRAVAPWEWRAGVRPAL